jgi:hypothetical protein
VALCGILGGQFMPNGFFSIYVNNNCFYMMAVSIIHRMNYADREKLGIFPVRKTHCRGSVPEKGKGSEDKGENYQITDHWIPPAVFLFKLLHLSLYRITKKTTGQNYASYGSSAF